MSDINTTMDILVLGADGYTGWPLTCSLLDDGRDVVAADHYLGREYRGKSVTPIAKPFKRFDAADAKFDGNLYGEEVDITVYSQLKHLIDRFRPHTVVNLAQIPSAPYSMESPTQAWQTQQNNILGSMNLYWALHELDHDAHVVQLATMGEYGVYPDGVEIPEGFLNDGRPAPKMPGSFYHASKVNMTVNTYFASKTWDIPTTEIYQGIVYGVSPYTDEILLTRFDSDSVWGTVLNRFTAQSVANQPLTVYGEGGQKRALLSLPDCIQCLKLCIDNPARGYRAVNQFDEAYRVRELAQLVSELSGASVMHIENPRREDDSPHFYEPEREVLDELGYEPTRSIREEFERTYEIISKYSNRISGATLPRVAWS